MTTGLSGTREEERGKIEAEDANSRDTLLTANSKLHQRLSVLFDGLSATASASVGQLEIRQVACDSRKVGPQSLFFALQGARSDGNAFLKDAIANGAVAIASAD